MGLTIHYRLTTTVSSPKDVRQLVEAIRQFALDLPFKEVGDVKEFKGEEADYHGTADETERWLKIQAAAYVKGGRGRYSVAPRHGIAFSTWPGEGCETANFGLCLYPTVIRPKLFDGKKNRVRTKLLGWQWASFCKTQYASNPKCGGIDNFLRCHLCVVKLLDFIHKTGLATVEVRDEGKYWERRDLKALAQEVGEWNEFIAGLSSVLRSEAEANSAKLEAAITGFQNFEHLEAKGLERLADLRRRLKQSDIQQGVNHERSN